MTIDSSMTKVGCVTKADSVTDRGSIQQVGDCRTLFWAAGPSAQARPATWHQQLWQPLGLGAEATLRQMQVCTDMNSYTILHTYTGMYAQTCMHTQRHTVVLMQQMTIFSCA